MSPGSDLCDDVIRCKEEEGRKRKKKFKECENLVRRWKLCDVEKRGGKSARSRTTVKLRGLRQIESGKEIKETATRPSFGCNIYT